MNNLEGFCPCFHNPWNWNQIIGLNKLNRKILRIRKGKRKSELYGNIKRVGEKRWRRETAKIQKFN